MFLTYWCKVRGCEIVGSLSGMLKFHVFGGVTLCLWASNYRRFEGFTVLWNVKRYSVTYQKIWILNLQRIWKPGCLDTLPRPVAIFNKQLSIYEAAIGLRYRNSRCTSYPLLLHVVLILYWVVSRYTASTITIFILVTDLLQFSHFSFSITWNVGWVLSVVYGLGYWLKGPGFEFRQGKNL